ncbi:hypothetical protein PAXRUDRAFT_16068 [Paxillus rubicundulus Ve08.2h10]|uniref:Uncharacterized protein n=1 Tax=Paxillus rubicundulus Ve08.2h10 TaxID=930991 RepID=A0A0D0CWL4_9AGAM|nr:hypothetical protein PAXRUDRAFT_16068 [Paxillus rubicundulus Ve08.2h10]
MSSSIAAPQSTSNIVAHLGLLSQPSTSSGVRNPAASSSHSLNTPTSTSTIDSSTATLDESASDLGEEDSLCMIMQTLRERSDLDNVSGIHNFTPTLEKIKLM